MNAACLLQAASSVYTTHITGNITRLAREAAHTLLKSEGWRRSRRRVALMTALWAVYAGGALAAAAWGRQGALAVVMVLAGLVATDAFAPIGGHERPAEPLAMF